MPRGKSQHEELNRVLGTCQVVLLGVGGFQIRGASVDGEAGC